jgi:hypothetical protein
MGVPFIPVGFLRVCSSAMSMALVCCGTAPLHLGKQPNFFFPKGETAGRFYSTKQIEKTKIRRETIQGVRETNSDDFRECVSRRYKILLWREKEKKENKEKKMFSQNELDVALFWGPAHMGAHVEQCKRICI